MSTVLPPPVRSAAPEIARAPSRVGPVLWMLATQAVMVASLAAWALLAGFSFLASPAEGALLPRPLLYLLWIYPVVPLACTAAAWSAFRRHDLRRARLLTALPLAAALAVLAFAWYMASPVG